MYLSEAFKQVDTALRVPEFLQRLIQILEKERRVKEADKNRYGQSKNWSEWPEVDLINVDCEIIERDRALYSTFQDFVIRNLAEPPLISADDLQEIALAQLGGMTDATTDVQLRRFIDHVLLRIHEFASGDRNINLGDWTEGLDDHENGLIDDGDLWEGVDPDACGQVPLPNGFAFDIEIEAKPGWFEVQANGFVKGICTTSAARQLSEQIRPSVESLVRSLKLAATSDELKAARESPRYMDVEDLL